jgi:predicted transcriptional regulator of viral defense system
MKGGLSETQKKLIQWLEQDNHWFVTTKEISSYLSCTEKEAHSLGFALSLKKWFATLGHNQYLLLRSTQPQPPPFIHPFIIGSRLVEPYYFSFHTAASYHKLLPSLPTQVYLVTTAIRNNTDIRGISYRFIHVTPRKFFGFTPVTIDAVAVNMADKEKTLIDSLEKFKYIGGLPEIIRLLKDNIDTLDMQRLVDYTVLMGSSTLVQRLGYILDHLNVSFDEEFLKSYSLGVLTYFDPFNTYDLKPKRDEKWNLMVNIPDSLFQKEP